MNFQPPPIDFLQGDFLGFIERFNEPDVFVNEVLGHGLTVLTELNLRFDDAKI